MNRETIHAACFALVTRSTLLVTKTRKLKHWADVPSGAQPALFYTQTKETVVGTNLNGAPTKWMLGVELYLYVHTIGDTPPGMTMNPLLDAITQSLDPTLDGRPQTLGNLVQWARIEGSIETDEGNLGDQAVAIIPIHILSL